MRPTRSIVAGAALAVLLAVVPTAPALAADRADRPVRVDAPIRPSPLGDNVYVFDPGMAQADIQATVDAVADAQVNSEFGPGRFALLFEPGTYGSPERPLAFRVGYYTEVAGLGAGPGDVRITGSVNVFNRCREESGCIALDNFWRALSNLTIDVAGGEGCRAATNFWAASQAAPMRGVDVRGRLSLMDYCDAGPAFASGGFIADSRFDTEVVSGSQQQYLVRNSELAGWSNGVWNQVFSGTPGAPPTSFGVPGGPGPYTTLPTTPVSMEEPRLVRGASGELVVRVPAVRRDTAGVAWTSPQPVRDLDLDDVLVATPRTTIEKINRALADGEHLLLTPGIYRYDRPIRIVRPGTVVLGLGLPTVVPQRGRAAVTIADVAGVKVSGVTVDAGPVESPVLVQVGTPGRDCACGGPGNPIVLQDLFVRIGGAAVGRARTSIEVNASNVLLDHIWAWRGDHGSGIGWTANTADTGVVVNGDDVSANGLFVEHYQKTQTVWRGERGSVVLYQNELPYDPPDQASWQEGPDSPGYPAFEVAPDVREFRGWGMGSYSFFNQGQPIEARTAFRVPVTPGVQLRSLLTVFLNGSGGIRTVVNDTGPRSDVTTSGQAQNVVAYPPA